VTDETWFWDSGGRHLIHVDNWMAGISSFYGGVADEDLVRIGSTMKRFHMARFLAAKCNFRRGGTTGLSMVMGVVLERVGPVSGNNAIRPDTPAQKVLKRTNAPTQESESSEPAFQLLSG